MTCPLASEAQKGRSSVFMLKLSFTGAPHGNCAHDEKNEGKLPISIPNVEGAVTCFEHEIYYDGLRDRPFSSTPGGVPKCTFDWVPVSL